LNIAEKQKMEVGRRKEITDFMEQAFVLQHRMTDLSCKG
jgi:hypothetical protein